MSLSAFRTSLGLRAVRPNARSITSTISRAAQTSYKHENDPAVCHVTFLIIHLVNYWREVKSRLKDRTDTLLDDREGKGKEPFWKPGQFGTSQGARSRMEREPSRECFSIRFL